MDAKDPGMWGWFWSNLLCTAMSWIQDPQLNESLKGWFYWSELLPTGYVLVSQTGKAVPPILQQASPGLFTWCSRNSQLLVGARMPRASRDQGLELASTTQATSCGSTWVTSHSRGRGARSIQPLIRKAPEFGWFLPPTEGIWDYSPLLKIDFKISLHPDFTIQKQPEEWKISKCQISERESSSVTLYVVGHYILLGETILQGTCMWMIHNYIIYYI